MTIEWTGVFPAVTSRFKQDGSIDIAEMERSFSYVVDAGVHGLIVCGSLGEASTLEREEKLEILSAGLRVAGGKIPVLLTIMEGSTDKAIEMAKQAKALGANGLMVLPGVPYRSTEDETVAHFRAVAQATDLPIMVYNNPVAYGVNITPEMLAQLADEPTIVAVKESSDDVRRVTQIRNALGDRFRIFSGVDNLSFESYAAGADGSVAGLVCAFPHESVAIWNLVQAGRYKEARVINAWFHPLYDFDVNPQLVQQIKLVEAIVYGTNDRCRAPRKSLVGAERKHVEDVVRKALDTRPDLEALLGTKNA